MMVGERVRLRPIERSDLPNFVRWFSDEEVRHGLAMIVPPSTAEEERWFERLSEHPGHLFAIDARVGEEWRHIGSLGLHEIDWRNRVGEVGIAIGEKAAWDHGFGTEAMRLLLRFAFEQLNLHRVELVVYAFNQRAVRCYERIGMTHEGTKRQAVFMHGQYHDVLVMGILRDEFGAGA